MKIKQLNNNRRTSGLRLMRGVSDTVYLAFVSIMIIGGTYYIYNDIDSKKLSASSTQTAVTTEAEAPEQANEAVEQSQAVETAKAEAEKAATPEKSTPDVEPAPVEVTAQAAPEKQQQEESKASPEAAANTASQAPVENKSDDSQATTQTHVVQNTDTEVVETEKSVADTKQTADAPLAQQDRMPPPRPYMMPNPYMQNPYYGGYPAQNNNNPYYQQRPQQQNYQQQDNRYRNNDRNYPEQYTPWNPGRFY